MSEQHLQRYVNEFVRRFNEKDVPMADRLAFAIESTVGTRLTYAQLTR